jgi:hypothetical protein
MRVRSSVMLAWATLTGCGHGGIRGADPEAIESAYLQARQPQAGCRGNDAACCGGQVEAARAAAAAGETARAAQLWEAVALACPAQRDQAGAAVLAASRLGPGAGQVINVSYRTRLPPAIRLYWLSATVGPRLLPVADAAAAPTQALKVEVHAIRFTGGRPGPLLTASRQFDIAFGQASGVTVEIAEGKSGDVSAEPLALAVEVDRLYLKPASPAPPPPPPSRRPPPPLEKARPLHITPARAPLEFGAMLRGVRPALRLCLDREGDLDTVRFLEQAHPRLAASVLDMLRDARHEPYRVGDTAVPSCETTRRS